MLARKYTKQIEVWVTTNVNDGFGGKTVTTALAFTMWAHVETKRATRTNENGQNDNFMQTVFTVRNRYDLGLSIKDNFIKYNGLIYNIETLLNVDLDNIDLQIVATQRT
jgi:SPP1 family predicted phage head-tail adaptor